MGTALPPGLELAGCDGGYEDQPNRSAVNCVVEIFGDAVVPGQSAEVGMGLHSFRDPAVTEDFAVVTLPIDVANWRTFSVNWMIAVFDFPERSLGADDGDVPALVIDYLRGQEGP